MQPDEHIIINESVYRQYFGFNLSLKGDKGTGMNINHQQVISLDKSNLIEQLPSRIKISYSQAINGLIKLAFLQNNLKASKENVMEIKRLSDHNFMESLTNNDSFKNQYVHQQEQLLTYQKEGKVFGRPLQRFCNLTQRGLFQIDDKGGKKPVLITKIIQVIETKANMTQQVPWLPGTKDTHRMLILDHQSQLGKALYFKKIEEAQKVRDFTISMHIISAADFNKGRLFWKLKHLVRLKVVEKGFYLLDFTAMKLLAMGDRQNRLSLKSDRDMIRQKTDSKDYRFPPLSSFHTTSSKAPRASVVSEQESMPAAPTLKPTNSDKSHWVDSAFGQSQKLSSAASPTTSKEREKKLSLIQELEDETPKNSTRKQSQRMRSQTEGKQQVIEIQPMMITPPEDAIQYEDEKAEDGDNIDFAKFVHQKTMPVQRREREADMTDSSEDSPDLPPQLTLKQTPSGYKVSFDQSIGSLIVSSPTSPQKTQKSVRIATEQDSPPQPPPSKLKLNNMTLESYQDILSSYPNGEMSVIKDQQSRSNIISANIYLYDLYEQCIFATLSRVQQKLQVLYLVGEQKNTPPTMNDRLEDPSHLDLTINSTYNRPSVSRESELVYNLLHPPQQRSSQQSNSSQLMNINLSPIQAPKSHNNSNIQNQFSPSSIIQSNYKPMPMYQAIPHQQPSSRHQYEPQHSFNNEKKSEKKTHHFVSSNQEKERIGGPRLVGAPATVKSGDSMQQNIGVGQKLDFLSSLQKKDNKIQDKKAFLFNQRFLLRQDELVLQKFIQSWLTTNLGKLLSQAGSNFVEFQYAKETETDTVYIYINSVRVLGPEPRYPSIKIAFGERRGERLEMFMEFYSDLEVVNIHANHHILKPTKHARIKLKDGDILLWIELNHSGITKTGILHIQDLVNAGTFFPIES